MFVRGAAARREEPPCLIEGLGLTNGRPSAGLLYSAIMLFLLVLSFLASSPEAFACRTRVPVPVRARARVCFVLSAAVGESRDGNSRGTGCERQHVRPRAHCAPVSAALLGEPPRASETFAGSQGPRN